MESRLARVLGPPAKRDERTPFLVRVQCFPNFNLNNSEVNDEGISFILE